MTSVNYPDSSQDVTYNYDQGANAKGKLSGITDPSGTTAFGFGGRGRLVSKTSTISGVDYTISRSYTPGGRVINFTYPSGRTMNFTRHNTGLLKKATSTSGSSTITLINNVTYNPFGIPKAMDTGTGSAIDNRSDENGLLQTINPNEMLEQTYTYNHNNNLTAIQAPNTPWFNQNFTYDQLNRLETASGVYGNIIYAYDNVGNRIAKTVDGTTDSYIYQEGTNRLTEVTGDNPLTFSYDNNGNVTGYGTRSFIYNQNNRLIRVEEGSSILGEYTYNDLGHRISKTVDGTTTVFHYDFNGNILAESGLTGTFNREYLYVGSNRLAMVEMVSNKVYHYQNNYLGTPVLVTDNKGKVVWDAKYKPFGETDIDSEWQVTSNFRFAGQYFDEETGLHYNYHRYYDPKTGRYLTPDPIGLEGGINLYAYVENNPINYIDPLGLVNTLIEKIKAEIATGNVGTALEYAKLASGPMAAKYVNQINQLNRTLQGLLKRYPLSSYRCDALSSGIYDAFTKVGANPRIIQITDKFGAQRFFTSKGEQFAATGFHQAVQVGNKVYDAITGSTGMQMAKYIETLERYGIYPIIK